MNPYIQAIAKPRGPVQENPANESADGETIFIPKSMCGDAKKGKEVMLKAKIASIGSKIGLTPIAIVNENDDEMGEGETETMDTDSEE